MVRGEDVRALFRLVDGFAQEEKDVLQLCVEDVAGLLCRQEFLRQTSSLRSLPEMDELLDDASRNLSSRGVTVENLYIHTRAVALAWQRLDWLKPEEYSSIEKLSYILSRLMESTCPGRSYLFESDGGVVDDGLRAYTGSTTIVFLRQYEGGSADLEIYPTMFTRSCVHLEEMDSIIYVEGSEKWDIDQFYRIGDGDMNLRVRHAQDEFIELELTYYDENGSNPRCYVYSYSVAPQLIEIPEDVPPLVALARQLTVPKEEAAEIRDYLSRNDVKCFFHFTDVRNLPSIRKNGGLFSWYYLETHRMKIENPGGDDMSRNLDMNNDSQDFVRMSFDSDNPMLYRKRQEDPSAKFVWLRISPEVATFRMTRFSDMNATDKNHSEGDRMDDLCRVDISATRKRFIKSRIIVDGQMVRNPEFSHHQAEVMCKTFVPAEYILNLDNPEYAD